MAVKTCQGVKVLVLLTFSLALLNAQIVTQLSFIGTGGPAIAAQSAGNYLFISNIQGTSSKFKSYDISDPVSPVALDSVTITGFNGDFVINGNFAFLAMSDNGAGIRVLDVSNPANIQEVLFVSVGETGGMFYFDSLLYVADGGGMGVYQYDSSQNNLISLWHYNTPNTDGIDVFVTTDYIYLNVFQQGLHIINPTTHQLEGLFSSPQIGIGVYITGNIAFVTDDSQGLRSVDISDPQNPVQISSLPGNGIIGTGITGQDNYLYFADGGNGLRVIDVSDSSNLVEVDAFAPTNIFAIRVAQNDSQLFVTSGDIPGTGKLNGVYILQNTLTNLPPVPGNFPETFSLEQNYPNPFNPVTSIQYTVSSVQFPENNSRVLLKVYDVLGREVKTLVNEPQRIGRHTVLWDGTNNFGKSVSSGVYYYRLQVGQKQKIRKMILLR